MNWMTFFSRSLGFVASVAIATTLTYVVPQNACAMVAPTNVITGQPAAQRREDLQKVQKLLESKVVRRRLVAMGLTDSQIDQRLPQLSDAQLHQVASRIDKMNAAGDDGVGIIVGLLVIGILVLLFVYLLKRV